MRTHDWSDSPVGPPEAWPQSLRAVVGLMLNSRFPMFVAWGPELGFLYNDAYAEILGDKHPAALGGRFREVWPEIWEDISPLVDAALAGDAVYREDLPLTVRRQGEDEQAWFTFSYSPVRDETGQVAGMFCAVTETTRQVLVNQEVQAEQARLAEVFESAPAYIAVLRGPDLRVESVNAAHRRDFLSHDWPGRTIRDCVPSLEGQGFFELLEEVYATGQQMSFTGILANLSDAPGAERAPRQFYDVVFAPLKDAFGEVTGVFTEVFDVTGRVLLDEARTESERELQILTDALPVLISYVGADRRYRFVNKAYETWFPLKREALVGQTVADVLGATAYAAVKDKIDRVLSGERLTFEQSMGYREGVREVRVEYIPRADDAGSILGFYALVQDVTASRAAEAALRDSELRLSFLDELGRAASALTEADDILAVTCRMTGEHLNGSVCAYADVEEDGDSFTIRGDWAGPGEAHIVGRYRLADFGTMAVELLSAGRPLVLTNIPEQIDPHGAATFGAIGIKATICMPLVKDGRLRAMMALHDSNPRDWSEAEQTLVAEVVERSWAHVERVRAEAELRESEARLRALTDNLPSAMVYQAHTARDLSWRRYTYVSANSERLTLVPTEQAVADPAALISYIDSADWPAVAAAELAASRELRMLDIELAGTLKDGRVRHFHCYSQPRLQPDGTLLWDGLLLDITDRHAAEQALRHSEAQLRLALDAGRLADVTFHLDDGAVSHGAGFAELFGHAPDKRLTLNELRNQYHPDDLDRVVDERRNILESGQEFYQVQHRIVWPDGSVRFILGRGRVARDQAGRPLFVTAIYLDETERRQAEEALGASEERLRLAAQAADMGAWDLDLVSDQGVWDEAAMRVGGLDPEAGSTFNGETWLRLVHPEDRTWVQDAFAASLEPNGAAYAVEFRTARSGADGQPRWITSHGAVLRDEQGKAVRAVGIIRDVTHRRRAETELMASESRFRALADAMPQLVWTADGDGRVDYYNARRSEYAGLTTGADGTYDWAPIVHPADLEQTLLAWRTASETSSPYTCEHRLQRTDGDWAWHVSRAVAEKDEEGRALRWYGTATDIHALKSAQERVEALNARLEERIAEALAERKIMADVVEGADAAVQVLDADFNVLAVNRMAQREYERLWDRTIRPGDNLLRLFEDRPEIRDAMRQPWSRALSGEAFVEVQIVGRDTDEPPAFEFRFSPLRASDGSVVGAYVLAYDVTERLQDQARLLQAEEALRQGQKMQAVGQLAGGIAHDFNNLLGAIVGSLDLVRRRGSLDDRSRRFVDNAFTAAERGAKLTGQLLTFARAQKLELKPLYVSDLLQGMRDLLSRTLGPGIELRIDTQEEHIPVLSDATQLEMAVLNLAINARDAMPNGGVLTLRKRKRVVESDPDLAPGDYVELSVTDTGEGMPAEVVARAFDPFFTTKGVGQGTGLGLSQVYGIAQQAGGVARIESRPGEGTTVRLFLRRTELPVSAANAPTDGALTEDGRTARVLVVDDDPELRRFLADSLDTLGFQVSEAADGVSGLAALAESPPDLLILDYAMPGMTGAEVARQVRAQSPDLPIVFASGYADTAAIEAVMGSDARILRKPFRLHDLQAMLADALG